MEYDFEPSFFGLANADIIKNNLFINDDAIEQRYQMERKLMVMVSNGDYAQAKRLFDESPRDQEHLKDFAARNPAGYAESTRDVALLLNTGLRVTLVLSNVPAKIIHGLATYYGRIIKRLPPDPAIMQKLYYSMLRTYCGAAREFGHKRYSPTVEKIVAYIVANLTNELSLNQIAAEFNYSPVYINRILKAETGYSSIQFIKQKRISLAKMLLNFDDWTVEQVAIHVGYHDYNYFCRVFRQVEGTSPAQYRETLAGDNKFDFQ